MSQKKGQSFGFQCKRTTGLLWNKAVQEVVAGHHYYQLYQAAVITNRVFSDSAMSLAVDLGELLMYRKKLKRCMRRYSS